METRRILIANTKTQKRHEINTNATTLGELKVALNEAGVDYSGMTFTEGISKTQLLTDDSMLPANVMYKGAPTNNLVMLLTNTTKNVASGCAERSRKDAYTIIKEWGEAAKNELLSNYGRNYTQLKTEDLWQFIDEHCEKDERNEETETPIVEETYAREDCFIYNNIKFKVLEKMWLTDNTVILKVTNEQPTITTDDIDAMIANL